MNINANLNHLTLNTRMFFHYQVRDTVAVEHNIEDITCVSFIIVSNNQVDLKFFNQVLASIIFIF